jgi:succinoglycan biosynthesis transport protein ExoP
MLEELEAKSLQSQSWDHYVGICRRRRWWVILPVFVVWGAVWAVSWFLPVAYKSETLILVEKQQVPQQYVAPNVVSDLQGRLQTMTQQILSRSRLARIIDEFQLYRDVKTRSNLDEMVDKMRKDITIEPVQTPGRREMQELNAFKISYSSSDPRLAQQVTGRLTSLFIDENLKTREQQSENTTSFLEAQLAEAGKTLNEQEQRIRDFKSKYLGALPDQLGSNMNILNGLQTRLQSEMQALSQSKQQSLYLETLVGQYRSIREAQKQGSTDMGVPPALDQELTRLKTQLADIQSHYTERHPDYRKVKEQIVKVEKMKEQMASDLQAAAALSPAESKSKEDGADARPTSLAEMKEMSPMLQVEGQVRANEFEIQARQKMIDQLEAQIQQYQTRLNEAPVRDQQLSDLTRGYEQSKANYGSLLAKKDQSELATSLEKRQQGEQFLVVDPPSFPLKPYKPDRLLLSLGGLLAGVLVGLTAAGFAEVSDDRVFDESDLQDLVKAPILTEIPALPTVLETVQARRRVRFEWMGATAMLLLTVAGFLFTVFQG